MSVGEAQQEDASYPGSDAADGSPAPPRRVLRARGVDVAPTCSGETSNVRPAPPVSGSSY